jgi:hypothetical protein
VLKTETELACNPAIPRLGARPEGTKTGPQQVSAHIAKRCPSRAERDRCTYGIVCTFNKKEKATWKDLKDLMLRNMSQSQKDNSV